MVVFLGTTDTDYEGRFDDPWITLPDANYLIDSANNTFAVERLDLDDVVGAWAGLRPLLHQEGKKPSEISRKDEIMVGPTGLISIAGGKLTTYRKMAERIVDMVVQRLTERGEHLPDKTGDSDTDLLSGGDTGDDIDAFTTRLMRRWPQVPADIVDRLVTLYGSHGERMVEAMANDPVLARRCAPGSPLTHAEVAFTVREEMALMLADSVLRRLDLGSAGPPPADELAAVCGVMARELGWDPARERAEQAALAAFFARRSGRGSLLE